MLLRPFLAAVLCCVVALGHAPAWLHVATCGTESRVFEASCQSNSGNHCGCKRSNPFADRSASKESLAQRHSGGQQKSPGGPDSEPSPNSERPIGEHSSDDCVICHSLVSALGQIDLGLDVSVTQQAFFLAQVSPDQRLGDGVSRALHLRGPPFFLHTIS
ncbi:MAG TPA: hypothetical protein DDZ51_23795 [Planctomycetaceae bacterium]|jgi:hypothetical protein|nr:hypothetical protein [Planctomycetaceae bacterium]